MPKAILLAHTTLVTLKAQITVLISPFVVKHCSKSLVFLSWGSNCFHGYFIALFLPCCMFSADGYFSWLCCQCIMALGTSTLVPLHLMGKCFKQLQLGYCIFLGPNGFLVHKNREKGKMHSETVWIAMSIKRYIHIQSLKKKHFCVLRIVFSICNYCNHELSRTVYWVQHYLLKNIPRCILTWDTNPKFSSLLF